VFRNDDPSAISNLEHEREIFAIFERHGVPQTIGVIPAESLTNVHDPLGRGERTLLQSPEHASFLRDYAKRSGSEIALHGYTHRTNRYSKPGKKEYFEFRGLPLAEQEQMISAGTEILEKALGVRPVTFIAPWNRLDENTVLACARNGYKVISAGPYVPAHNGVISFGANTNLADFDEAYAAAMDTDHRVFMNVNFHSRTIRTAEEKAQLSSVLERVSRDRECRAMTVAGAVSQFPAELRLVNEASYNIAPMHAIPHGMRTKTWVYFRTYQAIKRTNQLDTYREAARSSYLKGDYAACCALTAPIDAECKKTLVAARVLVFASGCAVGALAAALKAMNWLTFLPLHGLLPLCVLAVGGFLAQRATTRSSRRELMASVIFGAIGALATAMAILYLGKLRAS
jgi:peptidoglycan/xylan/chitin deacetylase (PgdA/CDA1 family)